MSFSPQAHDPVRVALTYRVCTQYRLPILVRLAADERVDLKVFHGNDIPGSKFANAKDFLELAHHELKTFHVKASSSGRDVPVVIYPQIWRALDQYRPDVLLCEGGSNIFNNLLIYGWARCKGVPTIWWGLGEIPGRQYHGLSRVYRWLRLQLLRRSDVLLGYSSRATDYFQRTGLTQPTFKAVNCIDTAHVAERIETAQQSRPTLRDRLQLGDRRVILFVGAVDPSKKLDVLLRAYKKVMDSAEDVALLIVGEGPALPELKVLADSLELQNVNFAGRVFENVSEYFLAADAFVLPGLGGLAISEAMAHGLPVLCTTADGCEVDLVQEGRNGWLFPSGDADALANALLRLFRDPDLLMRMKDASSAIIREQHNVHAYLKGIVDAVMCAAPLSRRSRAAR